ncbi:MAG: tetratricopeptide repeat protein [Nitrospina sp.]|jgi:protein O-mannosyl-transferase|nr:tetratricopeptide repeat protein [Nitrospina sp.]MBT5633166.1 tetratricopeptide repeat protein [Nitrospina sp.]
MRIAVCLFLVAITFLSYWQVVDHGFLNFDDARYVTENTHITKGLTREGMIWAFTHSYASNWHPVTWLSHMFDFEFYGLEPSGHHLTNLLFHITNALLLFGILLKMTGAVWRSGLVAILFALHPLNIESVAWIAERKNVLSTFFWFLTLWAYFAFVEKKSIGKYLLVVFFLALGLMSKPMLVTLPFVLLLLDFWPLKRWGDTAIHKETFARLILEKIPLFILVAMASVTTYMVQKGGGAVRSTEFSSLYFRIANALVSYLEYLEKLVWPQGLSIFYPHPGNALPFWKALVGLVVLVGVTIWAVRRIWQAPYLAVGWFWYLGTLVPVIGIVQVGEQAMADRYMYIPMVGIFIAIVWGLSESIKINKYKLLPILVVIPLLTALTWAQLSHWKSSASLFKHAISVTENKSPSFVIAYNNFGHALASEHRYEEAVEQFQQAIKINPYYSKAHNNLGYSLSELKRFDEAMEHYQHAINIETNYAEAYNNLANTLGQTGKLKESVAYYNEAIRFKGDYAEAYFNLGVLLNRLGKTEEAIIKLEKALEIKPGFISAHNHIGSLLGQRGDFAGAIAHYRQAINFDPEFAKAHNNLGSTLAQQGKFAEALAHFERAINIDPDYIDAQKNLRLARSLVGKKVDAQITQEIR